jgi:hypothetical protein
MSERRVVRILYLDQNYLTFFVRQGMEDLGVVLVVTPEVEASSPMYSVRDLPEDVVQVRSPLAPPTASVYHPSDILLRRIHEITDQGEADIIIIGNNSGAGVLKALVVAEPMRSRTIITAHSHPPSELYIPFGYTRFCPRFDLPSYLKQLIAEL